MAHLRVILRIEAGFQLKKGTPVFVTNKFEVRGLECMKMDSFLVKKYAKKLIKGEDVVTDYSVNDFYFYKEETL